MNRILTGLFLSLMFVACQSPAQKDNSESDTPPAAATANTDSADENMTQTEQDIDEQPTENARTVEPEREPLPIKELLGRINPGDHPDFVKIESKYTTKSGIYLRKEAYEAFKEMHAAAKADGITLTIVSATRTFGHQKGIWERKWTGVTKVGGKNLAQSTPDPVERAKAILTYSSMPGTSRHHWGTDIDLNNLNNSWFDSGTGKKVYSWLTKHASEYGFCQTYTEINENRPHGYLEEKWHWSYTPLSTQFLKDYESQIEHADIDGFKGSEVAGEVNMIKHYVSGVNDECK